MGGLLTRADEAILRAMHRYRFMTVEDVTFLLFSPGALTYVRALLKDLSGEDFETDRHLYRFRMPDTKRGNPHRVYTLGRRGRQYGEAVLGLSVDWHFQPERSRLAGFHHLQHSLALTKVLVAAEKWSGQQGLYQLTETRTSYELSRLRQLKQAALAIPDAWLLFLKGEGKHPVALEIDLGSENLAKFKQHIASRINFIQSGQYEEVFGTRAVLIVYLVIGDKESAEWLKERAERLRQWTKETLRDMGLDNWIGIFKFASFPIEGIYKLELFTEFLFK